MNVMGVTKKTNETSLQNCKSKDLNRQSGLSSNILTDSFNSQANISSKVSFRGKESFAEKVIDDAFKMGSKVSATSTAYTLTKDTGAAIEGAAVGVGILIDTCVTAPVSLAASLIKNIFK